VVARTRGSEESVTLSNWSQYFCNLNDKLSSILVDLGLKDLLRDDHRPRHQRFAAGNKFRDDVIEEVIKERNERRSRVLSRRIRVLALAAE
jgi:hypothetical protein